MNLEESIGTYTVCGFWDEDALVDTAVIRGKQEVVGGGEGLSDGGNWAIAVEAHDVEEAIRLAKLEMAETLAVEEPGDEDA